MNSGKSTHPSSGFSLNWRIPILFAVVFSFASAIKAFDPRLDGTMMPYDFLKSDTLKPWGDDLKPVFINYIARHGARFLSSEKKVESIRKELKKAKSEGRLSTKGQAFLDLTDTVISATAGRWGALNSTGIMEEQQLGKELTQLCPSLLKRGTVNAISTYVPRVVMSMYEVCHSLNRYSSYLEIKTEAGRKFNPLLRYFTTDSVYVDYLERGEWKKVYDNFVRENVPVEPARRMITGVSDSGVLRKLTMDAYGILQSLRASGINSEPEIWFSEGEYEKCWEASNLEHYLERSANRYSLAGMDAAKPLLSEIMASTASAFRNRTDTVAKLRFGHAETVMPLFALMRLDGCFYPDLKPDEVALNWKDWEVSPLGANLLIVCLEDTEGKTYVALRLNGRWQEIEGKSVIPWPDLEKLWQSYIRQ